MQHISYMARACVLAAAFVFVPVVALAGSDGSFSGTVVDPSGSSVSGATVVAQQRADRRGARGRRERRGPLRPDRPAALRLHHQGHLPGLRARRIHRRAAGGGAGVPARPDAPGRRRHRGRHGQGQRDGDGPQLGPHRRQRHRARGGEPAGERAPDVAADAAGAGLAERRHRHLERRPLQRPRQPAERDQVRRRRGLGDHRRRRPATSPARSPRRSSCRPASRTCRSSASSRTTTRPSSAPAPAARSASSPSPARTRCRARCSSTTATTALDAPNYFDSTRNTDGSVIQELPKSALSQHQFGGSLGGAGAEEPRLPLRQLRGLPPRRRRQLRRSRAERGGVVAGGAGHRAAPSGLHGAGRRAAAGRVGQPDFDIYQLQSLENVEENSFSARFDFRMNDQWSSYVRVFHDRGTQLRPEGVSGRVVRVTNDPTNAIFNVQGTLNAGLLTEFKVGYNAPKADIHGIAPVVNGIDFGNQAFNLSGSIANTGIAGQSASSGIVVPGGLVRANSATNGRAAIYDPSSIAFANTTTLVRGNHLTKFGADVRLIGMTFDQQGGTTYSFANIAAFLRQPAVGHPVPRRHQLAERVQQRRHRDARDPAAVLRRLRPGRMEGVAALHAELRPALRLLHAADGEGRPLRQVQPRHRRRSIRTRSTCTARRRTASSRGWRRPTTPARPCSAAASACSSARARART